VSGFDPVAKVIEVAFPPCAVPVSSGVS